MRAPAIPAVSSAPAPGVPTPLSLSRPGLASHLRALLAVAKKDWRIYWRYPLAAISRPLEYIPGLTAIYFLGQVFSDGGHAPGFAALSGSGDYMSFVLIGSVLSNFVFAVFWGMGYSLKNEMDSGVLEPNWLAPVPRWLLLVGRTLASLVITFISSMFMLVLAGWMFGFNPSGSLLTAVMIALPMLVALYGFGFAFAALVLVLREANTLVDVSSFLVQLLSGQVYPVQVLPRWLLPLSLALPLTHGLDALRGSMLGTRTLLPLGLQMGVLVGFMFVFLALGWAAFSALERRVRQRGTLGQH